MNVRGVKETQRVRQYVSRIHQFTRIYDQDIQIRLNARMVVDVQNDNKARAVNC